ncbi:hypothetical protein C8J57DRAFT_1238922 [Mycena rebaudengoi]|nr:hypothetical protein C8J57DRAFT_1238922 [Mycena rebaudengoi]
MQYLQRSFEHGSDGEIYIPEPTQQDEMKRTEKKNADESPRQTPRSTAAASGTVISEFYATGGPLDSQTESQAYVSGLFRAAGQSIYAQNQPSSPEHPECMKWRKGGEKGAKKGGKGEPHTGVFTCSVLQRTAGEKIEGEPPAKRAKPTKVSTPKKSGEGPKPAAKRRLRSGTSGAVAYLRRSWHLAVEQTVERQCNFGCGMPPLIWLNQEWDGVYSAFNGNAGDSEQAIT